MKILIEIIDNIIQDKTDYHILENYSVLDEDGRNNAESLVAEVSPTALDIMDLMRSQLGNRMRQIILIPRIYNS